MRRVAQATGLEGAPDIMLLTMAALMVAIVWLVSHVHESTLPPIDLPSSEAASLGSDAAARVVVTLRPGPEGALEVFVDDVALAGGLDALAEPLASSDALGVTLRADAATDWNDALRAMTVISAAGLSIEVAAEPI